MRTVDIYRKGELFVTIKPRDNSIQAKAVMGDNALNLSFELNYYAPFTVGDYCTVFGEKYILFALPVVVKKSTRLWEYTMPMLAEGTELSKAQYLFLGSDNSLRESDFSLMGNADDFIGLLLQNAARVGTGWVKGQVFPTGYKNLTFSKENCYQALGRIAEAFSLEFSIEGKTIHLTKRSRDTGIVLKQGQYKGLYEVTRTNVDSTSVITRLYAYGADKNLPATYKGKRLHLPNGYDACLPSDIMVVITDKGDGTKDLFISWEPQSSLEVTGLEIEVQDPDGVVTGINAAPTATNVTLNVLKHASSIPYNVTINSKGGSCLNHTLTFAVSESTTTPLFPLEAAIYVEKNTNLYGVIEYTHYFDDIYPHRTGKVTSIDATDVFKIVDSTMDFDVNAQIYPGLTPKVVFNTGQLAGYEFDINSYDPATKTFTILKNKMETAIDVPSTTLKPAIGDEYVLVDLSMPQSYITAAEGELKAKALEYLGIASQPQLTYQVVLDPVFVKQKNYTFQIGDLVWIVDEALGVQRKIRITRTGRNVVNQNQYDIELSDVVTRGALSQIISNISSTDRSVTSIDRSIANNSILNNRVIGTLEFSAMPETGTLTGFQAVYIETATGKLFRKV